MKISRNAEQSHLFLISSTIRGNGASFNQCSADVKTHYRMAHFTPLFFPGEGAEASEGGRSGHVGEASPLQLGYWWLNHRTLPVSCKHRPNHSICRKTGITRQINVHLLYCFVTWLKWWVFLSRHNSLTLCDSCKSLSVQRRSYLPRFHTESD